MTPMIWSDLLLILPVVRTWTCVWAKNIFRDVIPLALTWRRVTLRKESSPNKSLFSSEYN